jgi:thiamine transport system permease protein
MAGRGLALAVLGLTLGPLLALLLAAPAGKGGLTAADLAAIRFTLGQAAVSALLSCLLAIPVARALARRRFPGRGLLIALMGAPFLMPALVAVLALVAVFGRSGWLGQGAAALGLPPPSPYGPGGVVLAHVFLNLPLALRALLLGWQAIPVERFRLAESLGFGPGAVFRHLEWSMVRAVLPGAGLVILAVCLTSFAVALTLGGGPGATTVELAIYQALRFEGDLAAVARLALVQVALCGIAFALGVRLAGPAVLAPGLGLGALPPAPAGWRRGADGLAIALASAFLLAPLLALAVRGLPQVAGLPLSVWEAAGRSAALALGSGLLAAGLALPLALAAASGSRIAALAATLPAAVSALALGTGLFVALRGLAPPGALALPVTLGVNAALALPFVFRLLLPAAEDLAAGFGRLTAALGLQAGARLRFVVLPRLARALGLGTGLAAALAAGDLGVIALFSDGAAPTLPLELSRLMGAYRVDQAAGAAVVLAALAFALFAGFDTWGRRAAA